MHIENRKTKDTAWCKVLDRGPYGKLDAEGNWFNSARDRKDAKKEGREPREGTYIGILDMGRSVANKLKSKGRIRIKVRWWRKNPLAVDLDKQLLHQILEHGGKQLLGK